MTDIIAHPLIPLSIDLSVLEDNWDEISQAEKESEKGGAGSGNFGHRGRPGVQGGSAAQGVSDFEDGKPFVGVKASDWPVSTRPEDMYGAKQQSGASVRGMPISPDDPRIGNEVYHMTTNMVAVEKTGALLARGVGGLGGDNKDQIVSMTTSKQIADQLSRDMIFSVELAREFNETQPKYQTMEDRQAGKRNTEEWQKWGTPVVNRLIEHSKEEGWDFGHHMPVTKDDIGKVEYSVKDWMTQYFNARNSENYKGTFGKDWKRNPIIFTDADVLAKYDPKNIGVITIPRNNLKTGALLTDFDLEKSKGDFPYGLSEVRLYGDVPLDGASFIRVKEHDASIIAFDMSGFDLSKFSDKPIEDPHITLFFLGDTKSLMDKKEVENRLKMVADAHQPIKGHFTGFAVFNPSPNSGGKYPVVALFDSPELPYLHSGLMAAFDGIGEDQEHGFIPHMTIEYADSNEPNFPDVSLDQEYTLSSVSLWCGDEHTDFPLGSLEEKGGAGSGNFGHAGRPGQQGGSSENGVNLQATNLSAVPGDLTSTLNMIKSLKTERAIIKYPDGSLKWGAGDVDSVEFTEKDLLEMKGATLYHNHPSSYPLSLEDVSLMTSYNLKSIIAVTGKNGKFVAKSKLIIGDEEESKKFVQVSLEEVYREAKDITMTTYLGRSVPYSEDANLYFSDNILKGMIHLTHGKYFSYISPLDKNGHDTMYDIDWSKQKSINIKESAATREDFEKGLAPWEADYLGPVRDKKKKGGPGSGNFGHHGRPGKQGGSSSQGELSRAVGESIGGTFHVSGDKVSSEEINTFKSKMRFIASDGNKEKGDKSIEDNLSDRIARAYKNIDPATRAGITEFVFALDDEAFAKEYSKDGKEVISAEDVRREGILAYHEARTGKIVLLKVTEDVFYHECGHESWDSLPGLQKKAFVEGYKSEKFDHFTGYSDTQVKEGYAESYMLYLKVRNKDIQLSMSNAADTMKFLDGALAEAWERKKKKLHIA